MENYKKEKCSKQHLKIDLGQDQSQDIFMLANPMTYGDVTTPTSPPNYGPRTISNPNTPTNPTHSAHHSTFTRGMERLSLKTKNKGQSFFKRFGRSSSGGGGGTIVHKDEEDGGSSGSEHEDPFSPYSSAGAGDLIHTHRQMSEPPKSPSSNVEHYATLPRQSGRHHSGGHSSRDSGFSSERESVSLLKDDSTVTAQSNTVEDLRSSPPNLEEYRPAGMEALEILHNQLQLLVKRDTDDEETDSACVYEQVIANLSKQLEDQSLALDTLKQSEANLKLSLRLSQQRAVEAETKLVYAAERCLHTERKLASLTSKYKSLCRKHPEEEEGTLQRRSKAERKRHSAKVSHHPTSSRSSPPSSGSQQHTPQHSVDDQDPFRIPPQRVQSQTLYDRQNKWEQNGTRRPNTAQGFHRDQNKLVASITSLSHTETSV